MLPDGRLNGMSGPQPLMGPIEGKGLQEWLFDAISLGCAW